ncbi:MAG: BON domain-containing protein [Anaerolineae bacterium]|nr:BON domain-containing protein [Anaerolineae bacterium]
MTMFEKEIKLLVMAALRDNPDTCTQPIRVQVRGRNVMLSGLVANENVILEAIISVESVSEFLNVYSRLMVRETETTSAYRNVAATAAV